MIKKIQKINQYIKVILLLDISNYFDWPKFLFFSTHLNEQRILIFTMQLKNPIFDRSINTNETQKYFF